MVAKLVISCWLLGTLHASVARSLLKKYVRLRVALKPPTKVTSSSDLLTSRAAETKKKPPHTRQMDTAAAYLCKWEGVRIAPAASAAERASAAEGQLGGGAGLQRGHVQAACGARAKKKKKGGKRTKIVCLQPLASRRLTWVAAVMRACFLQAVPAGPLVCYSVAAILGRLSHNSMFALAAFLGCRLTVPVLSVALFIESLGGGAKGVTAPVCLKLPDGMEVKSKQEEGKGR